MKQVTHKHKDASLWINDYLVFRGLVFVKRDNEWIRSTAEESELITIEEYHIFMAKKDRVASRDPNALNGLIAEDTKNEIVLRFNSFDEAVNAGFKRYSIGQCLQGNNQTHKGYAWREAA